MALICNICKRTISSLDNQGTKESPICFDCANETTKCKQCGMNLKVGEDISISGEKYCKKCSTNKEIDDRKNAESIYQAELDKQENIQTE